MLFLTLVLALAAAPLRLQAASCLPSNAPAADSCQSDCCAKKSCCAVPKKNTPPVSQPVYQNGPAKLTVIGFVAMTASNSPFLLLTDHFVPSSVSAPAHGLPRLAATCIRLI